MDESKQASKLDRLPGQEASPNAVSERAFLEYDVAGSRVRLDRNQQK